MTLAETVGFTSAARMEIRVLCTGIEPKGRLCNQVLAFVEPDHWERDMASQAKQRCKRCHKIYRLADYL